MLAKRRSWSRSALAHRSKPSFKQTITAPLATEPNPRLQRVMSLTRAHDSTRGTSDPGLLHRRRFACWPATAPARAPSPVAAAAWSMRTAYLAGPPPGMAVGPPGWTACLPRTTASRAPHSTSSSSQVRAGPIVTTHRDQEHQTLPSPARCSERPPRCPHGAQNWQGLGCLIVGRGAYTIPWEVGSLDRVCPNADQKWQLADSRSKAVDTDSSSRPAAVRLPFTFYDTAIGTRSDRSP